MTNQYIWLYENLEKYQFHSAEAKKLHKEMGALQITSDTGKEDAGFKKLVACYNRFTELFNNNPFSYANGLEEFGIDANELDCYFIEVGGESIPVGFYKQNHEVEVVISLNNKLKSEKEVAKETKINLVVALTKKTQDIKKTYESLSNVKKATYFRAIIATISSMAILWYTILFCRITYFSPAGMVQMPMLSSTGPAGWWCMLILHMILLIIVLANVKNVFREYVLAYQKNITRKSHFYMENNLNKVFVQIDQNIEKDYQWIMPIVRQGASGVIEKHQTSRRVKRLSKTVFVAKEYIEKDTNLLRGIKSNSFIAILVISMFAGCFGYTILGETNLRENMIARKYERAIEADKKELRAQKLIQLVDDPCIVYKKSSYSSKEIASISKGVIVEVLEKEWTNGECWSKIQQIADTEIIVGWIPSKAAVPYNALNYDTFTEARIATAEASSYLIGQKTAYVPAFAYDWNRKTSWQDGNEDSTGEGEYLALYLIEPTEICVMQIFPGNAAEGGLYKANERVRRANITFSNGNTVTYEFDDTYAEEYQTIWLNNSVVTEWIIIEVVDTYPGEIYNDLCISEVHAFGLNNKQ